MVTTTSISTPEHHCRDLGQNRLGPWLPAQLSVVATGAGPNSSNVAPNSRCPRCGGLNRGAFTTSTGKVGPIRTTGASHLPGPCQLIAIPPVTKPQPSHKAATQSPGSSVCRPSTSRSVAANVGSSSPSLAWSAVGGSTAYRGHCEPTTPPTVPKLLR
jgi:hypothetical protein